MQYVNSTKPAFCGGWIALLSMLEALMGLSRSCAPRRRVTPRGRFGPLRQPTPLSLDSDCVEASGGIFAYVSMEAENGALA
jgi:hypothetical protein